MQRRWVQLCRLLALDLEDARLFHQRARFCRLGTSHDSSGGQGGG